MAIIIITVLSICLPWTTPCCESPIGVPRIRCTRVAIIFAKTLYPVGDIVGRDGVKISPEKVKVIQNWPRPTTKQDLQSFLGTAAYVQRFCHQFAEDAGPFFNLLKSKNRQVDCTPALTKHFERLKEKTPVLTVPNFGKDFFMKMDASDFAMGGVLYQKEVRDGVEIERPVAFVGRKYKAAELNYSIREKELLAILFGLRTWQVYLLDRPFVVETDHKSIETVFKQKLISRRIARWYDELAEYQFQIRYIKGETNTVADGISRRPDFMLSNGPVTLAAISTRQLVHQRVDASLSATVTEAVRRYDEDDTTKDLLRLLNPMYTADKDESIPLAATRQLDRYSLADRRIYYQAGHQDSPRLVLPRVRELLEHVCEEFYDSPVYGHPGIDRTCRLIEEHYYWPRMHSDIAKYVKCCEVCARTKDRNERPPRLLNSHDIPSQRWGHIAMDFITGLPSTPRDYDSVMVVIDQLTKRAHFVAGKGTDTASDVAERFHEEFFRLHGLPNVVVSARDAKFTSRFWKKLCEMLGVEQKMTTTFRPQEDGVSERLNQTLENYLRAFSNADSDDWDLHIYLVEFPYNPRFQSSIDMSPLKRTLVTSLEPQQHCISRLVLAPLVNRNSLNLLQDKPASWRKLGGVLQ